MTIGVLRGSTHAIGLLLFVPKTEKNAPFPQVSKDVPVPKPEASSHAPKIQNQKKEHRGWKEEGKLEMNSKVRRETLLRAVMENRFLRENFSSFMFKPGLENLKSCQHVCETGGHLDLCCICIDKRPQEEFYANYVDGQGFKKCAKRHEFYCPSCKSSCSRPSNNKPKKKKPGRRRRRRRKVKSPEPVVQGSNIPSEVQELAQKLVG